jgi:hypothetical protein
MRLAIRHLARAGAGLVGYTVHSGQWWMPLVVVLLVLIGLTAGTAQVVVPTLTYTLF